MPGTAMPEPRRRSPAPWVVAGALGVVVAALALVYFAILRPYRDSYTPGKFNGDEKAAVTAARTEMANLLSYRRARFEQDYTRALDGATGSLRTDIAAKKAATLRTLTTGKFDLIAEATHAALVGPADKAKSGTSYIVLVTTSGYPSTNKAAQRVQSLRVTVVKQKGKWLLSDVENVGLT